MPNMYAATRPIFLASHMSTSTSESALVGVLIIEKAEYTSSYVKLRMSLLNPAAASGVMKKEMILI